MSSRSLLSICIPTYNRASYLEQILNKMLVICQENGIHIYISDNASPDDTEQIVKPFLIRYPFIHYHRQTMNVGPDDNFEYVLKMSDSKYRWLMSDTCYVDNIDTLMNDLTCNDWDGYIVSAPRLRGQYLPPQKKTYMSSIDAMEELGWHLSWISCMIYNENLVKSMNFDRYKLSSFNQTALMFEPTANRECRLFFNPELIVKNLPSETKESNWQYHVFDVMYRQWYLLIMSLPLYYPYEIKKKCIVDNSKFSLVLRIYFQIIRRMEGKWSFGDVYRNRFFIRQAKGHYLILLFLGLCPKALVKCLFVSVKTFGHFANVAFRKLGVRTVSPY